jgi:hypothetical protein
MRVHPSGRQVSRRQIILRRHAKGVRDSIEESEQGDDVNRLCDLIFGPAGVSQFLDIRSGGVVSSRCDEFRVIEQCAFSGRQSRLIELSLQNRCNASIGGSLDTQEVGVAVQSIRAPV